MGNKPKIEVFTAGCPLCDETFQRIKDAVSGCGCEIIERRCTEPAHWERANRCGVGALPSIALDGKLLFEGRVSEAQAALLARQ